MSRFIQSTAKAPTGIFSTNGKQKQDGGPERHAGLLKYSKERSQVKSSDTPNTSGKDLKHQVPDRGQ